MSVEQPLDVPETLRSNVVDAWGDDGARWLANLPGLLSLVADRWSLEVGEPYDLSFNWVAPVRRADGSPAVLKLGVPSSTHLTDEASALHCFAGDGAIRLLDRDVDHGALLLERAEPGGMLRELVPVDDEEATAVIADILRRLHVAPPCDVRLPELAAEAQAFREHLRDPTRDRLVPRAMVQRALRIFDDLCSSAPARVVLHGDLHHNNVLRADRQPWLAIDPHGRVGDPGAEVAPVLYNPDPWLRDPTLLRRAPARLEQLADGLDVPLERAAAWGYAGSVLSDVWDAGDGGVADGKAFDVATLLETQLPEAYR